MAIFKVGQRVRLVGYIRSEHLHPTIKPAKLGLGRTGTILQLPSPWPEVGDCIVAWDDFPTDHPCGGYSGYFYQLAPLTDPLAEKFIASIKALGPLEEERA